MTYNERALAIIDKLTDSKAITIRERGTLRRAILLPERPQGKWHHSGECSVCHKRSYKTTPLGEIIGLDFTDFCKNCGADMRKGGAECSDL